VRELIVKAKALKKQLPQPSKATASAIGDSLSLILLHAQSIISNSNLPLQVEFSANELSNINLNTAVMEIDNVIDALEYYGRELQKQINVINEEIASMSPSKLSKQTHLDALIAKYEDELRSLQYQLELEQTRFKELKVARDKAWKVYEEQLGSVSKFKALASQRVKKEIKDIMGELLALQERLERERARLRELTFNRDLAWETYQTILRKYKETELALQSQEMEVRFVAPALPPTKPVIPKPKLYIAVATLLGLFLGTILAFLVEHLETAKVKESREFPACKGGGDQPKA